MEQKSLCFSFLISPFGDKFNPLFLVFNGLIAAFQMTFIELSEPKVRKLVDLNVADSEAISFENHEFCIVAIHFFYFWAYCQLLFCFHFFHYSSHILEEMLKLVYLEFN